MKSMKKKRLLAILFLVVFCGSSWGMTLYGRQMEVSGLDTLKQSANEKYEKQIYDEALTDYKACLSADPNDLLAMKRVAEIYHKTGQDNNCIAWCERVLRAEPENLEIRLMEARSYDNKKQISSAIRTLEKGDKAAGTPEQQTERDALLRELKGRYELSYFTFRTVYPWFSLPDGTVCATVAEEEALAVYTSAGKQKLSGAFSYLGACSDAEYLFPARQDNDWFFVDENGERREVPDGSYSFLGRFTGGLAPATRKAGPEPGAPAVAGYLDRELKEQRFEFEQTFPMCDGSALAKKDGHYFLLDSSLQETTVCEFVEVKTDVYRNAQKYGRILGRLPGDDAQWAIYYPDGSRAGEFSADDIRMPESKDGPLAFCRDGLWGFVSPNGDEILAPQFEDAYSFSKGMAPVRQDGKWGYIDKTGAFLIAPTFEEAGPLSSAGSAFVKNSAGYSLMTLSRYIANR